VNDSATTLEDTPVSGNVLANDTDVDGRAKRSRNSPWLAWLARLPPALPRALPVSARC